MQVTAAALAALAGCASTDATPGFRDMARTVQARTGHRPRWSQDTEEDRGAFAICSRDHCPPTPLSRSRSSAAPGFRPCTKT
jgi:hypothetical protein